MVSASESPVNDNWKRAIIAAAETDTVFLNQFSKPALRALRTQRTSRLERDAGPNIMAEFGRAKDLYFGGDMEARIALSGQVCGQIDSVKPVTQMISETIADLEKSIDGLATTYRRKRAIIADAR
jgi:enoyl-[acyl-carrier protein] reductase II